MEMQVIVFGWVKVHGCLDGKRNTDKSVGCNCNAHKTQKRQNIPGSELDVVISSNNLTAGQTNLGALTFGCPMFGF